MEDQERLAYEGLGSMLQKLEAFMQSLTETEALAFEHVIGSEASERIGDEFGTEE